MSPVLFAVIVLGILGLAGGVILVLASNAVAKKIDEEGAIF